MSFDLNVYAVRIPKALRARWQDALAAQGIGCEFRPDFDPDAWTGGDLLAKLQIDPVAFDGAKDYGDRDFVSGSGLDILHPPEFATDLPALLEECPKPVRPKLAKSTRLFFFSTSTPQSPEVFRFQVFAAATLTVLTSGVLHDPQDGEFLSAGAVLKAASMATDCFEKLHATRQRAGKGWSLREFRNWEATLKHTVPDYVAEPPVAPKRGATSRKPPSPASRRRGG